jgi:hypothetical protein
LLLCVQRSNAFKKEQNSRTDPSNSLHNSYLHLPRFRVSVADNARRR